ncbi:putative membrane protein SpoIIM required for sporulation [Catenulispora sp. MAP12-49]|uniref:stage II sporulation protein M n=1 Tax=unclassified Catenulispora TaxID=414885 RepID=UPI00351836DF
MDIDAYAAAHRGEWSRLAQLSNRSRALDGAEADELVALYQNVATHLSVVRSVAPDAVVVGHLSSLLATARGAIAGPRVPAWREFLYFFTDGFPAALYRARRWWIATAVVSLVAAFFMGWYIAVNPRVQGELASPDLVNGVFRPGGQFETYYTEFSPGSFGFKVWVNNAWVSALALFGGVTLVFPFVAMYMNTANLAVDGGFMAAHGRFGTFLSLVAPHGMLELSAVFVAGGCGMRIAWTLLSPGPRTRGEALGEQGRVLGTMALGLACVLLVSGSIEGFVTGHTSAPVRLTIGFTAETLFLVYVFYVGRRAALRGETGDVSRADRADVVPTRA